MRVDTQPGWWLTSLTLTLALALFGCSGGPASHAGFEAARSQAHGGFPALPMDDAGHAVSVIQDRVIEGDAFTSQQSTSTTGTDCTLNPPLHGSGWAMYSYATNGDPLLSINIEFAKSGLGQVQVYYGVSDYAAQTWHIEGPFTSGPQSLNVSGGNFVSPGGNFYFFVLDYANLPNSHVTVDKTTLQVDSTAPPTYSISGQVTNIAGGVPLSGVSVTLTPGGLQEITDSGGNYSFSTLDPGSYSVTPSLSGYGFTPPDQSVNVTNASIPGINFVGSSALPPLVLQGNISDGANPIPNVQVFLAFEDMYAVTDAQGNYTFSGLPPNSKRWVVPVLNTYSFAPANYRLNHNANLSGQDFVGTAHTVPSVTNYDDNMLPWLFNSSCNLCHSSTLFDADRHGAKTGINFDTYNGSSHTRKLDGNDDVQLDKMPPHDVDTPPEDWIGFLTTQFQKNLYQNWVDNDVPEN